MSSTANNALLLRPQWVINNQLTLPLVTIADSGKKSVRGLVSVLVPITIFLDTLFAEKTNFITARSVDQDQFQVYKSIEGALQASGVDGKSCLLRTICEMQKSNLGSFTLAGELATVLLTPKRGGLNDFLHDYLEAERLGRSSNSSCGESFPRCPVSLFNLFQSYSTPADKPHTGHSLEERGNNSIA